MCGAFLCPDVGKVPEVFTCGIPIPSSPLGAVAGSATVP